MPRRRLGSDEQLAWTRVIKTVRPLSGKDSVSDTESFQEETPPKRVNRSQVGSKLGPAARQTSVKSAKRIQSPRAETPANRAKERRVRRGQVTIASSLDLHGHTQASAARALPEFLANARTSGARTVLIITGKGRLGEGILRRRFLQWLEGNDARNLVSGYAEAHLRHGGSGAFYVFLRRV